MTEAATASTHRELTAHKVNGCNEAITIKVHDAPGAGGMCHQYEMSFGRGSNHPMGPGLTICQVWFQKGPIKEVGTNGITHEALLAILEDRFVGAQSGPYACGENEEALDHIRKAMAVLHRRTQRRIEAGIEGTHALDPAPARQNNDHEDDGN